MEFLSEILDGQTIPDGAFVYFSGDLLNQAHALLLQAYNKRRTEEGLTQIEWAGRIHKTTAVVNRHLAAAGNWRLSTIAEYLLGLRARLVLNLVFLEDLREAEQVEAPIDVQAAVNSLSVIDAERTLPDYPKPNIVLRAALANGYHTLVATSKQEHRLEGVTSLLAPAPGVSLEGTAGVAQSQNPAEFVDLLTAEYSKGKTSEPDNLRNRMGIRI
ncbi:hypothetical protein [Candidatus Binatus sp.]|uniref:hypothetical protein n=1 Tax=Candidatus Binatus sp. TaxID=2811406 RepID=UPI003C75EC74